MEHPYHTAHTRNAGEAGETALPCRRTGTFRRYLPCRHGHLGIYMATSGDINVEPARRNILKTGSFRMKSWVIWKASFHSKFVTRLSNISQWQKGWCREEGCDWATCMWLTGTMSGGPMKGLGEAEREKRTTCPRKPLVPEPCSPRLLWGAPRLCSRAARTRSSGCVRA